MSNQRFPKGGVPNPFRTYDTNFKQNMNRPYEPFYANSPTSARDQINRAERSGEQPISVVLPPNLYTPEDSQSLNIKSGSINIPANSAVTILALKAMPGMLTRLLNYGFTNPDPVGMYFIPTVNKMRVLPFHGTPSDVAFGQSFPLRYGTSGDERIECQLDLQPGELLEWTAVNTTGGAINGASVVMNGYVSQSILRKITRFGG